MSCYALHVSDDASSGHPEWPQPSRTWLGPFLFELPHGFCGFAATLTIDRILVHQRRLTTRGVERTMLALRAGLVGTYLAEVFFSH